MITMFKSVSTISAASVAMLCVAPAFADGTAPVTDVLNTQASFNGSDIFKVHRKDIFTRFQLTNTSRDGVDKAFDDYTVIAANLGVFKSSRVISDGVSDSNFKALPCAGVEYCASIANAAGASFRPPANTVVASLANIDSGNASALIFRATVN